MPEKKTNITAEHIEAENLTIAKPPEGSSGSSDVSGGLIRNKWRYDGTITLGHILIMVGILFSGISLYTTTVVKLSSHDVRIMSIERLVEGQSIYNKSVLEILGELKRTTSVSDALAKDRELRQDRFRQQVDPQNFEPSPEAPREAPKKKGK